MTAEKDLVQVKSRFNKMFNKIIQFNGLTLRYRKFAAAFGAWLLIAGMVLMPVSISSQSIHEVNKFDANTPDSPQTSQVFYAAPNGSAAGDGSINNPWDLQTALDPNDNVIFPGATIWLRGGVYRLPTSSRQFFSTLRGSATDPIKVASYPGEWAVIDGNVSYSTAKNKTMIVTHGMHTWYMNFEITNTETSNRKINIPSSNPNERRGNAIDDFGKFNKYINLVIHDTGQGIGSWATAENSEYYGNIVYNNGWDAPDRKHGHGNYIQNNVGTKIIEHNMFFNNFEMNSQTGGSSAAAAINLSFFENTFSNGGMAWRGPVMRNFRAIGNKFYGSKLKVGDEVSPSYESAEVRDNYAMGGAQLFEFSSLVTFENNEVWDIDPTGKDLAISYSSPQMTSRFSINNNTYYKAHQAFPYWHFVAYFLGTPGTVPASQFGDFAFNRTTGSQVTTFNYTGKSWVNNFPFDANSTYIDTAPSGKKVFVQPNRYDPKRANLIIYNWDLSNTVDVNVGGILSPGDTYELRNAQDYFGDVITGTYTGGSLQVTMTGRTRAKPIGYDQTTGWYHDPLQPNTFPRFGTFVLIKTNSSTTINQAPTVNAGADINVPVNTVVTLSGTATDDGFPTNPGSLTHSWSRVWARGAVLLANPASLTTTARFSVAGRYVLRLRSSDGELESFDDVVITVRKR